MDDISRKLELRVWYDEKSGYIKLAGKGLSRAGVSNNPTSVRYAPNLYRKLATFLRNEGAPVPASDGVMEEVDA